jgi:hypothetical protein
MCDLKFLMVLVTTLKSIPLPVILIFSDLVVHTDTREERMEEGKENDTDLKSEPNNLH